MNSNILIALVFLSVFLTSWLLLAYLNEKNRNQELLKRAVKFSGSRKEDLDDFKAEKIKKDRSKNIKKYDRIIYHTKDENFPFAKAGIYSSTGVRRYWMITAFLVILFPVGYISGLLLSNHELSRQYSLIALGLAGGGFFMPYFWLKNRIIKRKDVLMKAFPEAMDILVVCVEAGMGLDAAISRVSKEFTHSCPALAGEFHILGLEVKTGRSRKECWMNLARRVDIADVHNLVSLLVQAEKFGTGITAALRVNAEDMRLKYFNRLEEQAAKIPVKLTIPMILFILPSLFAVILGPAGIKIFREIIQVWGK